MYVNMKSLRLVLLIVTTAKGMKMLWTFVRRRMMGRRLYNVFPAPMKERNWMLGGFLEIFKNYHRNYDRRVDMYDAVEKETGVKHDTIQTIFPFWRNEGIALMTRDPVMVKHILKDDFDSWVKSEVIRDALEPLLGLGIFRINHGSTTKEDEVWSFQRKVAAKIFSKNVFTGHVYKTLIQNVGKLFSSVEKEFANHSDQDVIEFEMKKPMYCFTLDSIGSIGFGVDLDTLSKEDVVPFSRAFDNGVQNSSIRFLRPFYQNLGKLYASERSLSEDLTVLNNFSYDIIKQRKAEKNIEEKGDILSLFLQADKNLEESFLRDIIMSFMLAGRDTTACTLSFSFYLLATHPEIQDKILNELEDYFQNHVESKDDSSEQRVTFDILKQLSFLSAVVLETLRLFPPVSVNPKEAAKDTVLPNGIKVKKGTAMTYEVYAMTHDRTVYPNPYSFKPERWINDDGTLKSFDQYSFPVFQAGNRICLGKDMALYEVKFVLAEFLQRYKVELPKRFHPEDWNKFRNDVSVLNGETVYQSGVALGFKNKLVLNISRR